jgi:hypothetical protein
VERGGTGKYLNARAAAATASARFVPTGVGLRIAAAIRAVDVDRGLALTTPEGPAFAVAEPPEWLELHALIAMTPRSAHTDISRLTPVRRLIDAAGSTLVIVPSWVRRATAHRHDRTFSAGQQAT